LLDNKKKLALPSYATLHWSLLRLLNLRKLGQKLNQFFGVLEWEVGGHK